MELIKLTGVTKEYRKRTVLSDVDLSIEEGDILGVIGQSGSGKTTLLNLITGFISPSQGKTVYYTASNHEERDLNENLNRIKNQIGFTPQHNSFYPKLTVKENLWHFGQLYGLDKNMLKTNIRNLLNFTRLVDHQDKLAEELSGGMQKRLDISCSLVHKPKVLVLDEPTADLDPILQKEILQMLKEVNKQGVTIVIASHQLDCIENSCNKVVIVHNGRVKVFGSLEDVRRPYLRDHFTINVDPGEDKENLIKKLKAFPIKKIVDRGHTLTVYPEDVEKTMSKLLELIKEENLYLHDMHVKKPSLMEVFENVVLDNR
ncbi:MAG TPA: ABC transporter ATP-binding protein [Candidatus Nanoarchaeia archaeon]|nr:ABC transporter ATP-binding protein [Candidatus Nanoarchaeia archaeon]